MPQSGITEPVIHAQRSISTERMTGMREFPPFATGAA
jgi:hypothetical protein